MFTLFDLMRAAQGGAAMENMARQFGLSVDQTRRAMEALMPAFALGFQRSAGDPMGFSDLLRTMASGRYAGFFDQAAQAFSPGAKSAGDDVLAKLFGPEVSRQVAQQAAAWAGIAPEIMRQMMPTVAATLMGGLFRSTAQEGLAGMLEGMARAVRAGATGPGAAGPTERPAADPLAAWASLVGTMWGAPGAKETPKPAPNAASGQPGEGPNPFAPWMAMMNAMAGGKPSEPEPPRAEPPRPESPQDPFALFGQMFTAGREVQDQYLANLQSIFDAYRGAGPGRR